MHPEQDFTYQVPQGFWIFCTSGLFKCPKHRQKFTQIGPCLLTMLIPRVTAIQGGPKDLMPIGQPSDMTQAGCCLANADWGKHSQGAWDDYRRNNPLRNRFPEAS